MMDPAYSTDSAVAVGAIPAVPTLGAPATLVRLCQGLAALVSSPLVIGACWFVLAFAALLWVWGTEPVTFSSPDEAVNRLASSLVEQQGDPFLTLPHDDPEDLAHPRFWVSIDDHAVPAYPPAAYYMFGAVRAVPWLGPLLFVGFMASGLAAFAAGTARIMPRHAWLSLLAPLLGFPAVYWSMRPWINMSLLLVFLCWAFLLWTVWLRSQRWSLLAAACLPLGAAAAVRPDFAPYLLLTALFLGLGQDPGRWRGVLGGIAIGAAVAVGVNLLLNYATTGNALVAAYQLHRDRAGQTVSSIPAPFDKAYFLLLPWGWPDAGDLYPFFKRYWVMMGPVSMLLAGQVALVPLLAGVPRVRRLFYAGALLVIAVFVFSRMSDTLYGANEQVGLLRHSIPRYWSPVYLFAGLPPLLFAARCRSEMMVGMIAALGLTLAALGAREVYDRQPESMTYLRDMQVRNERMLNDLTTRIPEHAMVYTMTEDKILWSRWGLGLVRDPGTAARSMRRSIGAGQDVYVVQASLRGGREDALQRELAARDLALVPVLPERGLYHVIPQASSSD